MKNYVPAWVLGGIVSAVIITSIVPAMGQTTPAAPVAVGTNAVANPAPPMTNKESEQMAPIVVTGSLIPTTDTDGPSPVLTVTADDIAQRGNMTLSDALLNVPQVNSFSSRGINGLSFNGGGAYVSLRGLGPQATLVLVNGLRVTPFGDTANGQYSFVDINSFSVADVDRVEVLANGASAVYGSDAVAGVINIILKPNLGTSTAETNIEVGNTTEKDAFEQSYNQAFGLSSLDKNGNGIVSLNYYQRNSIMDPDRSYASTSDLNSRGSYNFNSAAASPGLFYTGSGVGAVGGPNGFTINPSSFKGAGSLTPLTGTSPSILDGSQYLGASQYLGVGNTPGLNTYNYTTLVPSTTRYGAYANYGYNFYDGNVVPNFTFNYEHLKTYFQYAPTPYFDGDIAPGGNYEPLVIGNYTGTTGNYYNRTGQDILVLADRFFNVGDRSTLENTDDFMGVPSVKIKLGPDWTANIDVNYSYSGTLTQNNNFLNKQALLTAFNSPNPNTAYDPFSGSNSPSVIRSIIADSGDDNYTSLLGEDATFNGKVFDMPAGPLTLAVGVSNRRDEFSQHYTSTDTSGNTLGSSAQQNLNAYRTVQSGYGEIDIPVVSPAFRTAGFESLDIYAAGRVDDYSDFGATANPEIRFRWSPIDGLIVRGSFSTAFRAPSLTELYAGANDSYVEVTDPTQGNKTIEIEQIGGGNSALQPETAQDWDAGVVYAPPFLPGFKISTDFYKILYENQIAQPNVQTIVDANNPAVVTRDPISGDIISVKNTYENLGSTVVTGMDSTVGYVIGDPYKDWGQLDLEMQGALIFDYYIQSVPGQDYVQNAGSDTSGFGGIPRYRQNSSLFWNYRTFSAGVSNSYTAGYKEAASVGNTYDAAGNPVTQYTGAYSTFDIQASYEFKTKEHDAMGPNGIDWLSWLDSTKITVGCDNVAQFTPPFVNNNQNDPLGSDPNYADYRGRFWYVAVKKVW